MPQLCIIVNAPSDVYPMTTQPKQKILLFPNRVDGGSTGWLVHVDEMANNDIKTPSCQEEDGIRTDDENENDSDVENNPEEDEVVQDP